jgi:hypothetical protein
MSLLNNSNAIPTTGGDYNLENSLRFRSSASAYLNRTPASAGNRKTWTWSGWAKRGSSGTYQVVTKAFTDASNYDRIIFFTDNTLRVHSNIAGAASIDLTTNALFRDPSSWYHIIVAIDTTQATASNRAKLFVNGEQASLSVATYPALNADTNYNNTILHSIGAEAEYSGTQPFDGYQTEINFVDGQALTASDFGEYNSDTGVWQPARYTGTYGTNGFYLKGRGTDNSGNGNNWTENNFNTTTSTATTYDIMTDVPTLTDEDTANYATMNPVDMQSQITLSEGNLKVRANTTAAGFKVRGTQQLAGKIYFEGTVGAVGGNIGSWFGIADNSNSVTSFNSSRRNGFYYNSTDMRKFVDGAVTVIGSGAATAGDIIGLAFDLDGNTFSIYKNNVALLTSQAFTNDTGFVPIVDLYRNDATDTGFTLNFGQRPFAYTPPTGFKKLNTFNLPDSSIVDGSENFNTVLYTGNGSTNAITGVGFSPDFVWIKSINDTGSHSIQDTVRGAGGTTKLCSNSTNAENNTGADATDSIYGYLTAFGSDGFTAYVGTTPSQVNKSTKNYASWNWKAGGTAVSNTAGTITSLVSANPTAGFSVLTFTGTETNQTVGHGLGVAPELIITKNRDLGTNWVVGNTPRGWTKYLFLNLNNAEGTSGNPWNNTAPTNSVYTVGTASDTNGSSQSQVAYCFASVEGYSKIGSYTGNGSVDGVFNYTGFRPAYIMVKVAIGFTNNWHIFDSATTTYNPDDTYLLANGSGAEVTANAIDFLSNGFKLRNTSQAMNNASGTYIYMAFAENPFKNSLAR